MFNLKAKKLPQNFCIMRQYISDGVSRLGLGLETCLDVSRDPLFEVSVSVSKVSGLVSVSKDFGLSLELFVSRLSLGFDSLPNLLSTPFKIYTEFNKKCACTNETAARNLCNERLGVC